MNDQARKAYAKQYRQEHKKQIQEYIQKYKLENRDHVLAVQRKLNHKNYTQKEIKPKIVKPVSNIIAEESFKVKIERGSFFVTF
jgi:hypothetical protein